MQAYLEVGHLQLLFVSVEVRRLKGRLHRVQWCGYTCSVNVVSVSNEFDYNGRARVRTSRRIV